MIASLLNRDLLPDGLIRIGIRRLLRDRLAEEKAPNKTAQLARLQDVRTFLRSQPIAVHTSEANEQHYEVPTTFFRKVLGPRMKYSSCLFRYGETDLGRAEQDMLDLTVKRAELDGARSILELGCGWGSLTLFMAERYPKAKITAVSNSRTQKEHIDAEAKRLGLTNVTVLTADMNEFRTSKKFDRVVSVEMFEHMRNHEQLFGRIHGWLKPGGKLFVHIFTHKEYAYLFQVRDASDWMAQYFFTGGIMPSDDLFLYSAWPFRVDGHWRVSGTHYQKTARAWLRNMDAHRDELMPLLARTYGASEATKWWVYWRVFFMACEELWGFRNGEEWMVSHYLFAKA